LGLKSIWHAQQCSRHYHRVFLKFQTPNPHLKIHHTLHHPLPVKISPLLLQNLNLLLHLQKALDDELLKLYSSEKQANNA
jgi:hypothetical protein